MKWLLISLMTTLTVFAGCVGGGDDSDKKGNGVEPVNTVRPSDVDPTSDFGVLQGFVVDADQLPIGGANVGLRELELSKTTDDNGVFQFIDLQPGTYTLDVAKLGFEPVATQVTLVAGQLTESTVTLTAIETVETAYYTVSSFAGYYECALGAGVWVSSCSYPYTAVYYAARDGYCAAGQCLPPIANLSNYGAPEDIQNNPFRYNFTVEPGAEDVISEMQWVSASAASTRMMLIMSCGDYDPILDDCSPHYGPPNGVDGPSPLRMEWSADLIEELPGWVMARGYLPFAHADSGNPTASQPNLQVALNQKFEIWNTIFYYGEAPEGFSIFVTPGA